MKDIEYMYYGVCFLCIIALLVLLYKCFKKIEGENFKNEPIMDFRTPLSNSYNRTYRKYHTTGTLNLKKLTVEKLKEEFGEDAMTTQISNIVNNKIILEDSDEAKSIKAFLQKRSDCNNSEELKFNTFANMFLKIIKTTSFAEKSSEYELINENKKSFSENDIDSTHITDERLKIYEHGDKTRYNKGKVSFSLSGIFYEQV